MNATSRSGLVTVMIAVACASVATGSAAAPPPRERALRTPRLDARPDARPGSLADARTPAPIGDRTFVRALPGFASCTEVEAWARARTQAAAAAQALPGVTPSLAPPTDRPAAGELGPFVRDGAWLYAAGPNTLGIVDVADPHAIVRRAVMGLPGGFREAAHLSESGGVLSVVSRLPASYPAPAAVGPSSSLTGYTLVTAFDVADPASPRELRTDWLEGALVSARDADGTLVLVLDHAPAELVPGQDAPDVDAVLPRHVRLSPGTVPRVLSDGRAVPCDRLHLDAVPGTRLTVVVALDPASGATAGAAIASGAPRVLGGSGGSVLFAAGTVADGTRIHEIALGADGTPRAVATGVVPGQVMFPEGLDRHGEHVRAVTQVALQDGSPATTLTILRAADGGIFESVGTLAALAPAELPQTASFDGDRAWIVTSPPVSETTVAEPAPAPPPRAGDPVFGLDLSDPAAPRVTGELHIPGIIDVLHALPDGRLLGVGSKVDDDQQRTGLALTLVEDVDGVPVLVGQSDSEWWHWENGATSPAQRVHRALAHDAASGLVVLPFLDDRGTPFVGTYRIDLDGIRPMALGRSPWTAGTVAEQLASGSAILGAQFAAVSRRGVAVHDGRGGWLASAVHLN